MISLLWHYTILVKIYVVERGYILYFVGKADTETSSLLLLTYYLPKSTKSE